MQSDSKYRMAITQGRRIPPSDGPGDDDALVVVINLRDIEVGGWVDLGACEQARIPRAQLERIGDGGRIRRGDVVLTMRGARFGVAIIDDEPPNDVEAVIASPLVGVHRPPDSDSGELLRVWLAMPSVHEPLSASSSGPMPVVVSKAALDAISPPIPVPPTGRQLELAHAAHAARHYDRHARSAARLRLEIVEEQVRRNIEQHTEASR